MSAFARMEAQMRAKKKAAEAEQAASQTEARGTTNTKPTGSGATPSPVAPPAVAAAGGAQSWSLQFPMQRPVEPEEGMCCDGGCENCVWTQYADDLAEWEAQQETMPRTSSATASQRDSQQTATNATISAATESNTAPTATSETLVSTSDAPPSSSSSSSSSSPPSDLSRFARAMESEREVLSQVLPSGPGNTRTLGAIIRPKNALEEHKGRR